MLMCACSCRAETRGNRLSAARTVLFILTEFIAARGWGAGRGARGAKNRLTISGRVESFSIAMIGEDERWYCYLGRYCEKRRGRGEGRKGQPDLEGVNQTSHLATRGT